MNDYVIEMNCGKKWSCVQQVAVESHAVRFPIRGRCKKIYNTHNGVL